LLAPEEVEQIAAKGWQLVRELLPAPIESDGALRMRLDFLKEILYEVGQERFVEAVKQAIRISQYRSQVTVARIRQCAGLSMSETISPAVHAWTLVTTIVTRHVGYDANGCAVLEPKVRLVDGKAQVEPVPEIPESVREAVKLMGGWGNLKDSYPNWWGSKFVQFKEVFRG
jgi:hypothetical protein